MESHKEPLPILVYRNQDQKLHFLSLEEFEAKTGTEYLDTLFFSEEKILHWALKKGEKRLAKECYAQMNRWALALYGEALATLRRDHFYIRYINPQLGYGVFAAKEIPALTYIGEYTGVVEKRHRRLNERNDYIFGYVVGPKSTPFVINAEKKGNFTRFINHSDEPNLTSRWVIVEGITRIILFSNRLIKRGEQLTYDYGPIYWKKRSNPELI